jgi:hypothetical protein
MKAFLAALLARGASVSIRTFVFVAIMLIGALVSWASPFAFFVVANLVLGCAWFDLARIGPSAPTNSS